MGRIRTIKPEFPDSETVGHLSREARLLFIQLWTIADDYGKSRAASRMLASRLYPYDDDAPGLIEGWLSELERGNAIVRYKVDGSSYLLIVNWDKHQKVDKPTKSRIPDPLDYPRENSRDDREVSSTDLGPRTMDHGPEDQVAEPSSLRSDAVALPPDPKKALWDEGRPILVKLAGIDKSKVGPLLGSLSNKAGGKHAELLALLRQAATDPPLDPVSWLTSGAQRIGGNSDLLSPIAVKELPSPFSPANAWGAWDWIMRHAGVKIEERNGREEYTLHGWYFEDLLVDVLTATGAPTAMCVNLEAFVEWLRDDIDHGVIRSTIKRCAERPGYKPVSSLAYFNTPVREAGGRQHSR